MIIFEEAEFFTEINEINQQYRLFEESRQLLLSDESSHDSVDLKCYEKLSDSEDENQKQVDNKDDPKVLSRSNLGSGKDLQGLSTHSGSAGNQKRVWKFVECAGKPSPPRPIPVYPVHNESVNSKTSSGTESTKSTK